MSFACGSACADIVIYASSLFSKYNPKKIFCSICNLLEYSNKSSTSCANISHPFTDLNGFMPIRLGVYCNISGIIGTKSLLPSGLFALFGFGVG